MGIFSTIGSILGGIGGTLIGGPAGASLGSSLGGGLGGLADGKKGANDTKNATNQAVGALNTGYQSGINLGNAQQAQTSQSLAPWLLAGQSAIGQQGDLVGLNGAPQQQAAIDQLRGSPLFRSLYGQGENALLANASATGGLRGGNTQRSLYGLGEDTLAKLIQSQLGNLGGISQLGAQVGGEVGKFGAVNTSSIQDMLARMGAANASGISANQAVDNRNSIQSGNILNGLFGQGGAGSDILGQLLGGFGGGGSAPSFGGNSGFTSNNPAGWLDGAF